jgi:hypothetical protein
VRGDVAQSEAAWSLAQVLGFGDCRRAPDYLLDAANWVSYDEAVALWRAGAEVTYHPAAGNSGEVARRLADAVPLVVDCDRVGVYLWDGTRGELVRRVVSWSEGATPEPEDEVWSITPSPGGPLERYLSDPGLAPMFVDTDGGDEFAVLIDANTTPKNTEALARRLADAFRTPFSLHGLALELGASVGRAVFPIDADSAEGLLRYADASMFAAKRGRR